MERNSWSSDSQVETAANRSARTRIERHHWLNTIVGVIDAAWNLTAEEQFHAIRIVSGVLQQMLIPDRGEPREVPIPLALEVGGGFYSAQLTSTLDSGIERSVRPLRAGDQTVPLDVWRDALVGLVTTSYPDLEPLERVWLTRAFDDLLAALGVTERAPVFLPEDVVRLAREL